MIKHKLTKPGKIKDMFTENQRHAVTLFQGLFLHKINIFAL